MEENLYESNLPPLQLVKITKKVIDSMYSENSGIITRRVVDTCLNATDFRLKMLFRNLDMQSEGRLANILYNHTQWCLGGFRIKNQTKTQFELYRFGRLIGIFCLPEHGLYMLNCDKIQFDTERRKRVPDKVFTSLLQQHGIGTNLYQIPDLTFLVSSFLNTTPH